MAARRMMLPDYGTVSMKGTQYYRTRVTDQQGRRVSLYARTREELYQKEQEAIQQIENKTYRRSTPTSGGVLREMAADAVGTNQDDNAD
mgnify:CR=1 FL=1